MKIRKNSKKGFTLVELVVVIAIIGILAGIAIVTIIPIVNNAKESSAGVDAHTLEEACQDYVTGIYSGSITSADHGNSTQLTLPAENASASKKKEAIKVATVINACEYAGLDSIINDIKAGAGNTDNVFVYDENGKIYYSGDKPDLENYVTETTTLGDLYGL